MFPTNREIWKSIDGYANYEVSSFGRVRQADSERILKPFIRTDGYHEIGLTKNKKRKKCYVHRLVANEFIDNINNKQNVDHINHDKGNNCVENLRWATNKQNQRNVSKQKNTSSIYKGVSWEKKLKKWRAMIQIERTSKHLGLFNDEVEAALAYNEAAKHHFGEYALLNDV